jgi:hypothetical protein
MFKFKSQMTGCLSMTGWLQNLPLTTTMYNTHINHSSKATVFLLLKRHNQLWNSVTVASSGLFELRDTMYTARHLFSTASHGWSMQDEIKAHEDEETSGKQ